MEMVTKMIMRMTILDIKTGVEDECKVIMSKDC